MALQRIQTSQQNHENLQWSAEANNIFLNRVQRSVKTPTPATNHGKKRHRKRGTY